MSYGRIMNGGAVEDWARSDTVEAMGDLFRALATPVRLSIVMELSAAPRAVGELVEALGVSQPLVSQHLRVLRAARLTVSETSWPRGSSSSDVTGGVPSSRALAGGAHAGQRQRQGQRNRAPARVGEGVGESTDGKLLGGGTPSNAGIRAAQATDPRAGRSSGVRAHPRGTRRGDDSSRCTRPSIWSRRWLAHWAP
ncbi:ArsR/SmtB family transcription factor [Serratia sp. IR-2025]